MAFKVPIAILQQKVYGTSRRLAKFVRIEPPKKEEEKKGAIVVIQRGRTIGSGGKVYHHNLFDREPHLKRFFYLLDNDERAVCRNCGKQAVNGAERSKHIQCYLPISNTIRVLREDELCVVCETPYARSYADVHYNGLPVCSDSCMDVWESHNPQAFEFELKRIKQHLKHEEAYGKGME